jgi:hypothetical protein
VAYSLHSEKIPCMFVQTTIERKRETMKSNSTIEAYLAAFNSGDLNGILQLFSDQVQNEACLGFHEYSKKEMINGSMKSGLCGHKAISRTLWGRPVIVVVSEGKEGPEIYDIQIQDVENGKIVYHKSYFFRKEFILAAAKELNMRAQLVKPSVDWS